MDHFISLVTEMSPYLLLGFLLAGLMHAFIPRTVYSKYLARPNMRSVILAALFGIPLPLLLSIPAYPSLPRTPSSPIFYWQAPCHRHHIINQEERIIHNFYIPSPENAVTLPTTVTSQVAT